MYKPIWTCELSAGQTNFTEIEYINAYKLSQLIKINIYRRMNRVDPIRPTNVTKWVRELLLFNAKWDLVKRLVGSKSG